jgi:hypothetical protein
VSADSLWQLLDRIGIVAGLLLAVPVIWTWWQVVFGESRRRRRWLREIMRQPGSRPGVLIVDLLPGKDISTHVRQHLTRQAALLAVPEDRQLRVTRTEPMEPGLMLGLARDIRSAVRRMQDTGVDVLHLFYAGPDVAALLLGAELCNGPRVLLHHYEQGAYHCFGPLEPLRGV